MSLNSDQQQHAAWGSDANNQQQQSSTAQSNGATTAGTVQGGLASLFGFSSMTSDNRNLNEAQDTLKQLEELYKGLKNTSISELQRKIIPSVEALTSSISPSLPGVGLKVVLGDTMYVMAALFANSHLTINSERINITVPNGYGSQQVSIPLTPVQYANKDLLDRLKEHYTRVAEGENIKHVAVINMLVVDLDMMNHPEAGEAKDLPRTMAMYIASEWEESIMVKSVQEIQAAGSDTPNPFQNPSSPYGRDNLAEARVTAISGRVTKGKTLTPANMEIIASTISNNQNQNNWQVNSKEICRVQATVSLHAVSWDEFSRFIMSHRTPDQMAQLQSFLGASAMGGAIYPNGYRPLRPVITMDSVQAGEMLGYNGGLYPYFYALYLLMCSNNNFVFAEAVRKHMVGARGNLSDLEVRIQQMLSQMPNGNNLRQPAQILDDKKITDTDFVNNWIRQNVSAHATFQVNLLAAGPHASIYNFLLRLANAKNNAMEVKTVVSIIDAMSNKKLSAIIERNVLQKSGWIPSKPVLLPTGMIAINGLATYGDKKLNTQELDEMMISHIKGKNGLPAIESFLGTQYGVNPQEDFKQRCQKLRIEATSAIFDGAVHINGFAQPHIWAPDFMAALGEAMDSIGQLNVANNIGSFRNSSLVYAPGVGLATVAAAGSNNVNGQGLGVNYNLGVPFM